MAYTDLTQVKLKMGIPAADTSLDVRLQYFIDAVCAAMTSVLGDLTLGTKTETISCCDIKCDSCCCRAYISLAIMNATVVNTIDGNAVDPADQKIVGSAKDRVLINNINTYIDVTNDFCYFDIEYEAWFDPIPKDLAYAAACLVESQFKLSWGKDVTSEKLLNRTVTFGNIKTQLKEMFPNIMLLYTKVCL